MREPVDVSEPAGSAADATLADFERSLAAVLRRLADRGTVGDVARRSGYNLPPASWALLEHLDGVGSMRVSDIAACHGVDVSSVTPRLKSLQNAGLVSRETLPTDARVSLISITAEGRQALESVHAARREILAAVIDDTDTRRITVAAEVLAHIAARLSGADAPGQTQ